VKETVPQSAERRRHLNFLSVKPAKHGLELSHVIMSSQALSYHEPGIVDILTLSSFLLILNAVSSLIDCYLYCGLIGQILIGVAWGAPGAAWLSIAAQETITQLGYLGLILLVFEGGLSTSFSALKTNMLLSVAVATVGILLPMALSFSLIGIADATPLQAFAAGAALCSTSLGTTFTLLSSSGLVTSRLGVVLSSAAMLDDVVGLVMVQIISNLGTFSSVSAVTVVRPILVSVAFATILPTFCFFIIRPAIRATFWQRQQSIPKWMKSAASGPRFAFVIQALLLIAFVTGASYAGTSNLFTAYLAGATISWWGAENAESNHRPEDRLTTGARQYPEQSLPNSHEKTDNTVEDQHEQGKDSTGAEIYTQFVEMAVRRILKPFFFVSSFWSTTFSFHAPNIL
jgi:NhaP-type Na+/H+ and K+/H+ antiporter